MVEIVIFIAGCIVSWLIAHLYFHRSSIKTPEWAKEIVKHLPSQPPSEEELVKLFQKHLDSGEVEVNPLLGRVACPQCGESVKNFEEDSFGDDSVTVVAFTCPGCGWSENVQT